MSKAQLVRLSEVEPEEVRWLWPGRIPLGKLTILDGDPGTTKTTLALDLAARVTRGDLMPDGSESDLEGPRGVVLLTAEDGLGDTIRPRLDAAGADSAKIVALPLIEGPGDHDRLPTVQDVDAFLEAIEAVDAALIIFDPLAAYLGEADSHRDASVRAALAGLAELAEDLRVAVLAIRHLNKKGDVTNALYRGMGSIGFTASARSVLLVGMDPDDPEEVRRVLAWVKGNLARPQISLAYRPEIDSDGVVHIKWLGPSPHTKESLLVHKAREHTTEREKAKLWLRHMLSNGPVQSRELKKLAEEAGHAWKTLQRAGKELEVEKSRDGFGGPWIWTLSEADDDPEASHGDLATFEEEDSEHPQNERTFSKTATFEGSGHLPGDDPQRKAANETNSDHLRESPGETGLLRGRTGEDGQDTRSEPLQEEACEPKEANQRLSKIRLAPWPF